MTADGGTDARRTAAALRAEIGRRIEGAEDVERLERHGSVDYLVGERAFASADDGSVSFRLGGRVARAAAGTAGTSISPRGPEWVRFAPSELDRFTLDRAVAWLDHALRLARQPGAD